MPDVNDKQDPVKRDASLAAVKSTANLQKTTKVAKPVAPIQKLLKATWLFWLGYRLLALPILIALLNAQHPDMLAGIAWQALWLIPAFIITPVILRGNSPYALLISSIFTLVYFGASGVILFDRAYGVDVSLIWIYGIDLVLLLVINSALFLLLKRLPSMNKPAET